MGQTCAISRRPHGAWHAGHRIDSGSVPPQAHGTQPAIRSAPQLESLISYDVNVSVVRQKMLAWTPVERIWHFSQSSSFCIWHLNCEGLRSHLAEIPARIHLAPTKPSLLCLNETFLDKAILDLAIPSYDLVVRRDRDEIVMTGGNVGVWRCML